MVWFIVFIGLIFAFRFVKGMERIKNPPKPIQFYDKDADVVETALNAMIVVTAVAFVVYNIAF